jgi:tetratricopeptide (TPR) repeat protein
MTSGMRKGSFHCFAAVALLASGLSFGSTAIAQQSRDRTWCDDQNSTDDQTIAGCTAVIKSGRDSQHRLAVDYYNRGLAYRNKGDYDRAIADYNQAIRLDPKYAAAYNNRGRAYADKGDHDPRLLGSRLDLWRAAFAPGSCGARGLK